MKNYGGQVFPSHANPDDPWTEHGMTLRDYFAAKAMEQMMAYQIETPAQREKMKEYVLAAAATAYGMADAMLAERAK